MKCKILDIGISDYSECYSLQKQILDKVKNGKAEDTIIITEHRPVMTIGRSSTENNLLVSEEFLNEKGIKVIKVDRGGDITYHGPGQIVMYPIIDLKNRVNSPFLNRTRKHENRELTLFFLDLHKYMHFLEDVVIALLKEYSIDSFKEKGKTGVWTRKGKISSIGIGVSRWVTYHGVSLNVDCDLTPYSWINPCGFKDAKATSMKELTTVRPPLGCYSRPRLKHTGVNSGGNLNIKKRLVDIFCEQIPSMA